MRKTRWPLPGLRAFSWFVPAVALVTSFPAFAQPTETVVAAESKTEQLGSEKTGEARASSNRQGPNSPQQEDEAAFWREWSDGAPKIGARFGTASIDIGGRIQLDARGFAGVDASVDPWFVRRARMEAKGELGRLEYKLQADFAGGEAELVDGFVTLPLFESLELVGGRFKAPFSQEELESSKYMDFIERSGLNLFAPKRKPGIMARGSVGSGMLQYSVGAFAAGGPFDPASGGEAVARLRFRPFESGIFAKLELGGAHSRGTRTSEGAVFGRTASRSAVFFAPLDVNGDVRRSNAEFSWRFRNLSIAGEYDQIFQERIGLAPDGGDLARVLGHGYSVRAAYVLTGEKKTDRAVRPRTPVPDGWGAWEVAVRYENLDVDGGVESGESDAWSLALNWWLTSHARFQTNWAFERFDNPALAGLSSGASTAFMTRLQFFF